MIYTGSLVSREGAKCLRPIIAAVALAIANTVSAAGYVDLRRIEPIQGDAGAGAAKAMVCAACHGPNGNSVVALFPKLAGQRSDYLYYRLREFKSADPKDEYYAQSPMPAQVANFTDKDMRDVAAHFAEQARTATPLPTSGGKGDGEALYLHGDPARGIPPCQGCHGANAAGPEISHDQYAAYPSLRGQQAAYLVTRLTHFRNGMPRSSTNDFIMQGVAQTLDDDSISSVAAWLSSLPPDNKN
jgi:cytochrome c553